MTRTCETRLSSGSCCSSSCSSRGVRGVVLLRRRSSRSRGTRGRSSSSRSRRARTRRDRRRLADAGVVRDALTFRLALWLSGDGTAAAGRRVPVRPADDAAEVVAKIARGDVYVRPITFPEGLTIRQMATLYESRASGRRASSSPRRGRRAGARTSIRRRRISRATCSRTPTRCRGIRRRAARRADGRGVREGADAGAARERGGARGLTVRQLVTLASIVEKETGKAEERPLVAAVYANRLRIGMGLQCDPTVIYALRAGAAATTATCTRDDLQFDSPYNTYRYAGLPPGPIAAPGRASLEAAADPADVDVPVFRQPQRRLPRVRGDARGAQPERVQKYQSEVRSGDQTRMVQRFAVQRFSGSAVASSLALAPFQLLAQHVEVAARRRADEPQRPRRRGVMLITSPAWSG